MATDEGRDLDGRTAMFYAVHTLDAMRFLCGEIACVLETCAHLSEAGVCGKCAREALTMLWTLARCDHGRDDGAGPGACQECIRKGEAAMHLVDAFQKCGVVPESAEFARAAGIPVLPHVSGWRKRKRTGN